MDSKQSRELTQKQKDLVKRLEKIRNNRENTEQSDAKKVTKRNENAQQNRPAPQKRTRTASERKFARPVLDTPAKIEPIQTSKPEPARRKKRAPVQRKKRVNKKRDQKKNDSYISKLSGGGKLSQAIILSEILDKPLALRRR